jgi:hypothetical protein
MERDDTAAIMAEIAKLSDEMRQLRQLVEAEVIRADDMPILPVFQRGCFPVVGSVTENSKNKQETDTDTRIEIHPHTINHITPLTTPITTQHKSAEDTDQTPATRSTRCNEC